MSVGGVEEENTAICLLESPMMEVWLGYDVKYGKYEVKSLNSDDGDQYVEAIEVSPMVLSPPYLLDNKWNTSQNHWNVTLFIRA